MAPLRQPLASAGEDASAKAATAANASAVFMLRSPGMKARSDNGGARAEFRLKRSDALFPSPRSLRRAIALPGSRGRDKSAHRSLRHKPPAARSGGPRL